MDNVECAHMSYDACDVNEVYRASGSEIRVRGGDALERRGQQ